MTRLLAPLSLMTVTLTAPLGCMWGMGSMDHGNMGSPAVQERPPTRDAWELTPLEDHNPAAAVLEVALEARVAPVRVLDGREATMWTYNGLVPGPLLEANVGDELIVHFTNSLPESTTIHWHGLRLPPDMDGVGLVVPSGGTFEYRFIVRDAGTFWYHPHVRSEDQVRQGLYGALVVHGPRDTELPRGRTVVLSDVLLDENGALAAPPTDMMTQMVGVEGNFLLVNGKIRPVLTLGAGEKVRLRLINAAPSRYFNLVLPGHRFWLLGEDGGLLETPFQMDRLLLVPGQRADVVVEGTGQPGTALDLEVAPYERGHGTAARANIPVLRVEYTARERVESPPLPAVLGVVETPGNTATARTIRLGEGMGGHAGHGGGSAMMSFTINGQQFPNVPLLSSSVMAQETWTVVNETTMDHPFHLHGFFFQVVGQSPRAWRDTVNIPANSTVTLTVNLDGFPGRWMYHCHILGHAERGMMGELEVLP